MKTNLWILRLTATASLGLTAIARGEEKASPVMTALSPTVIGGYVDTSAQWNFGTGNAHLPAYLFGGPNKADGFNLNVVKLVLEKPVRPSDEWGAGYKVDLLFGPDAIAYGTQTVPGDFAVKQAYLEVKAPLGNGIDFKVGVWDTILGYEVFETPLNPNFTRSYGYTIDPATFTGILAAYQFNELIGMAAGVADSMGSVINSRSTPLRAESYKTYLGDISLTAPKEWGWVAGSTLFLGVVNGFNVISPATGFTPADQISFCTMLSLVTPIKDLKAGFCHDFAGVSKQKINRSGYANAVGLYANYQLSQKLSLNGRGEYFAQSKANAAPGLASKMVAVTGTVQYDLWQNVLSRFEFRWDHAADGTSAFGGFLATDAPTRKNACEFVANLIYKF